MNPFGSNTDCSSIPKGTPPRSTLRTAGLWIFGALFCAAITLTTVTLAPAFTDSDVDCSLDDPTCGTDPNSPPSGYLGDTNTLPPDADSIDVAPLIKWSGGKSQGNKCLTVEGCMTHALDSEQYCENRGMQALIISFTAVRDKDGDLVLSGMNWKCVKK
jgi:hypothetical protein